MSGNGWLIDKYCRLQKTFGWPLKHIQIGMTGAMGWVYYAWAIENEAMIFGNHLRKSTDSYCEQEFKKLKAKK